MKYIAHVKWFVDEHSVAAAPYNFGEWVLIITLLAVFYFVARLIHKFWRKYDQKIDKKLAVFRKYLPTIIGVVTGLSMVVASSQDYVFAPNIQTDFQWLVPLQAGLGILLIAGAGARPAAFATIGLYFVLLLDNSLINLLEHLEYLGGALLVITLGRGPVSLTRQISVTDGRSNKAVKRYVQLVGLSLAILALSEKLAAPALAEEFLHHHNWNLLAGLGVTDRHFALILGTIELIFGVLLVINIVPRLVILAILGAMATTATLLGIQEVYGHIFALGLAAAVWIGYEPLKIKAPRRKAKTV